MINYRIARIEIKNFRSIGKLILDIDNLDLITICGANNVGKTNVLRAMNLFFSNGRGFNPDEDIPYHITQGARGGGYKTTIKLSFKSIDPIEKGTIEIEKEFSYKKSEFVVLSKGKRDKTILSYDEVEDFLSKFRFIFIESNNINLPKLIVEIVNDEILPLGLQRKGKKQTESLLVLKDFIDKSKGIVSKIEKEISKIFLQYFKEPNSIDTDGWRVKINFPEYEFLREAISGMIDFTLFDSNDHKLDSKGGGMQRIILLSLIEYINTKSSYQVIWGIDEPEVFLQPGLQKSLYKQLNQISKKGQVIITTHSHFFVNINELESTFLLIGKREKKEYSRKPGNVFYKVDTDLFVGNQIQKILKIKQHLGISNNDTWDVMPFNILVEGKEDKDYLEVLCDHLEIDLPNVISAGAASKFTGIVTFINNYASDIGFKPIVVCLFDNDSAGRDEYQSLQSKSQRLINIDLQVKRVICCDKKNRTNSEIEDLIYPDLILKAANKILKKRGYKQIPISSLRQRTSPAYNEKVMLVFLTEKATQENSDKHPIDFEKEEVKLELCSLVCKTKEEDFINSDIKYPEVKIFLKSLFQDKSKE